MHCIAHFFDSLAQTSVGEKTPWHFADLFSPYQSPTMQVSFAYNESLRVQRWTRILAHLLRWLTSRLSDLGSNPFAKKKENLCQPKNLRELPNFRREQQTGKASEVTKLVTFYCPTNIWLFSSSLQPEGGWFWERESTFKAEPGNTHR